ncbi:unnamed protein product [Closterium sp. Naga37s-1]|nr:unnamed protein product [Closterium sp. Naga37s-1]
MAIDLKAGGRNKKTHRTAPKSRNPYLLLLVKIYRFLARRTGSPFNKVVLRRLFMSRTNRPPVALSRVLEYGENKGAEAVVTVVGKVTDDKRLYSVREGVKVCALAFSATARARIEKAGGECLSFDQLALQRPTGINCLLLRGKVTSREAFKHFGPAPGVPHSHTRPYVRSQGRKREMARGRRNSRGFKCTCAVKLVLSYACAKKSCNKGFTAGECAYSQQRYGDYSGMFLSLLRDGGHAHGENAAGEEEAKERWDVFSVVDGQFPSAQDLDAVEAVVVTGSKHDAHADDPWIERLCALLLHLHRRRTKILGVCFGHQVVGRALGGRTGRAAVGWELGIKPVQCTADVASLPYAASLPSSFKILEVHRDQVDVAAEALKSLEISFPHDDPSHSPVHSRDLLQSPRARRTVSTSLPSTTPTTPSSAPRCGHCKRLIPTWSQLADELKEAGRADVSMASLLATEHRAHPATKLVRGFPTLIWFHGARPVAQYEVCLGNGGVVWEGDRSRESLQAFMEEQAQLGDAELAEGARRLEAEARRAEEEAQRAEEGKGAEPTFSESVVELTDGNFQEKTRGHTFVMFHAEWCGHCKRLIPVWSQLADEIKQAGRAGVGVAALLATQHQKHPAVGFIQGFPTLIWFHGGQMVAEYSGDRSMASLRAFVEEQGALQGAALARAKKDMKAAVELKMRERQEEQLRAAADQRRIETEFAARVPEISLSDPSRVEGQAVVVLHYADWCHACGSMKTVLLDLQTDPPVEGLVVGRFKDPQAGLLAAGNTLRNGQPTTFFVSGGRIVDALKGVKKGEEVREWVRELGELSEEEVEERGREWREGVEEEVERLQREEREKIQEEVRRKEEEKRRAKLQKRREKTRWAV